MKEKAMTKSEQVYSLLSDILGKDVDYLKTHTSETGLWDSLKRVEIIFTLEEQFDVMLEPEEVSKLNTIDDIMELVEK